MSLKHKQICFFVSLVFLIQANVKFFSYDSVGESYF